VSSDTVTLLGFSHTVTLVGLPRLLQLVATSVLRTHQARQQQPQQQLAAGSSNGRAVPSCRQHTMHLPVFDRVLGACKLLRLQQAC
jgi:hypothetical protein